MAPTVDPLAMCLTFLKDELEAGNETNPVVGRESLQRAAASSLPSYRLRAEYILDPEVG